MMALAAQVYVVQIRTAQVRPRALHGLEQATQAQLAIS